MTGARVRFGSFEADLATGELFQNGAKLALQHKPFAILALLLQTPGQLVTRQAIMAKVWPDVFVQNNLCLNTAMRRLRAVLEKADPDAELIETVGSRGYRLRGEVEVPAATLATSTNGINATKGSNGGLRLAVLPFTNLNHAARDYFSDGLTEQMIVQLGRVYKHVSVISPVSSLYFKRKTKSLSQIARELRADYVLSGSVWRISSRLRITARLTRTDDECCLWSESYARQNDEIFKVQDEITRAISRGLLQALPEPAVSQTHLETAPGIYGMYLKARFFTMKFVQSSFVKATQLFGQVIAEDPHFAPAPAGLALMLSGAATFGGAPPRVFRENIERYAGTALAMCEEIAEAHTALGWTRLWEADWTAAEKSFLRALEINPSFSLARAGYAELLVSALDRQEEGVRAAKRARDLDPFSPMINTIQGLVLYLAGRLPEALECQQSCIEMNPTFCPGHMTLAFVYGAMGEPQKAVGASRTAAQYGPDTPITLCLLAWSLALAGDTGEAGRILRELVRLRNTNWLPATWFAAICIALGELEQAWKWLESAMLEHDPWRVFLAVDRRFEVLRNHARYLKLLREIGLPSTSETNQPATP